MQVTTMTSGQSITAQQTLCTPSVMTPPQTPVNTIPAPVLLEPICPAQAAVRVRNTTINATLVLLKNGVVVGNGGAAPGDVQLSIAPPASFTTGNTVSVVEYIGSIVSPTSNAVTVNCAAQNVVTQHNNNARQGEQRAETALTPANVSGPNFGLLYERHVVGTLLAHPLYVHSVIVRGELRNVIYVSTAENVVYAIAAIDDSASVSVRVCCCKRVPFILAMAHTLATSPVPMIRIEDGSSAIGPPILRPRGSSRIHNPMLTVAWAFGRQGMDLPGRATDRSFIRRETTLDRP